VGAARGEPDAARLPDASDAAFSLDAYVTGIEQRVDRLWTATDRRLQDFLRHEFVPSARTACDGVRAGAADLGVDPAAAAPQAERTLSPGDVGFHNALRRSNGSLTFVDFEYAGWDDAAQVLAQACLAPEVPLPQRCHLPLLRELLRRFGDDPGLGRRVRLVYPLLAVKWSLILLNEFVSLGWERRLYSGALDGGSARRIDRSKSLLVTADRAVQPGSWLERLTETQ
jgi:hypothetical protein